MALLILETLNGIPALYMLPSNIQNHTHSLYFSKYQWFYTTSIKIALPAAVARLQQRISLHKIRMECIPIQSFPKSIPLYAPKCVSITQFGCIWVNTLYPIQSCHYLFAIPFDLNHFNSFIEAAGFHASILLNFQLKISAPGTFNVAINLWKCPIIKLSMWFR